VRLEQPVMLAITLRNRQTTIANNLKTKGKNKLRAYMCRRKKQRMSDPSWTREKETSNALFVHGIMEMQIPTRPILFK